MTSASARRQRGTACTDSPARKARVEANGLGARIREQGFSRKLHDRRVARLIADAVAGVKTSTLARCDPLRENERAHFLASHPEWVPARQPLITRDDLMREFAAALSRAGISWEEALTWPPLVAQTRISRLEEGTSTAPGRQIHNIAEWCVQHRRRPDWLVHEEVSGSIYRRRRRSAFESFYDDIVNDRVRDSVSGQPITEIACFLLERFTRDPEEGGAWLTLLRQRGMNLYETYYREPPRPLHQTEHEIRDAWNGASKEVERNRERIMDALATLARQGLPTYGRDRLIGHQAVRELVHRTVKTIGYKAVPEEAAALRRAIGDIIDGSAEYAAYCALKEARFTNSVGTPISLNSFRSVLRSPRLFGGLRLKTDRARVHGDPDYAGDLYPEELIHEAGEAPPPGFVPPIEPIISYPEWVELQLALARRSRGRGPRKKHLGSGYLVCSACGGRLVAGGIAYHCPKVHLRGVRRVEADDAKKLAHDGKRHPTVRLRAADQVISEVLFAAVDTALQAADLQPTVDLDTVRSRVNEQIRELDSRLGDISYMLAEARISRATYDEWCEEIDQQRQALRSELRDLQPLKPIEIPNGLSLRDVWPEMDVEHQREILGTVIEQIILAPADDLGSLQVASRMTFVFRDGYEPPADELAALLERVEGDIRRRLAPNRLDAGIEAQILDLHKSGLAPSEISERLRAEQVTPPNGGCWDDSYISVVLRRICRERGIVFVPNRRDRSKIPYETRELIVALSKKLRSYAAVARELNALEIRTAHGKEWTSSTVRAALAVHEKNRLLGRRGAKPENLLNLGRPPRLSEAMREQIWTMHRLEKMTLTEIGRWLKQRGIKTAGGKEDWANSTVLHIVRSIDTLKAQELAAEAEQRQAA